MVLRWLLAILLVTVPLAQAQDARRWHGLSPFEMQAFVAAEKVASDVIRGGNVEAAIKAYDQLILRYPKIPRLHVNRAILLALAKRDEAAIAGLQDGAQLGFRQFGRLKSDPALEAVMTTPAMQTLLAQTPDAPPAPVFTPATPASAANNQLTIQEANVDYLVKSDILLIRTQFPERPFSNLVAQSDERWAARINRLYGSGKAAGNHGDLYENRDNGHSNFRLKVFPQVTKMTYGAGIDAIHKLSEAVNLRVIADAIVFGNSSTAFTQGPLKRSLVRWAMTQPGGANRLFTQHRANQLYVYPEVWDFEPDYDRYPGYFAAQIVSEGRSGSDKLPMNAIALALAALRPEVKAELKKRNMITPVIASIVRRATTAPTDPLSDLGHRTAIRGEALDMMRVIDLAQALTIPNIPPRVVMRVEDEPKPDPVRTVFAPITSETVYTTPTSIARRAFGTDFSRSYRLGAATQDTAERTYTWRILAGDPRRIKITPLDERNTRISLSIDWHDPFPTAEGEITNRVDIGVFAKAGDTWSSPAVFSLQFPRKQTRIYSDTGQLLSIDYADPAKKKTYADPLLSFRRAWKDTYILRDGVAEGWTRLERKKSTRYAMSGDIVDTLDDQGRPIEGRLAQYTVEAPQPPYRRVSVKPGTQAVKWSYSGPDDRIGTRSLVP